MNINEWNSRQLASLRLKIRWNLQALQVVEFLYLFKYNFKTSQSYVPVQLSSFYIILEKPSTFLATLFSKTCFCGNLNVKIVLTLTIFQWDLLFKSSLFIYNFEWKIFLLTTQCSKFSKTFMCTLRDS